MGDVNLSNVVTSLRLFVDIPSGVTNDRRVNSEAVGSASVLVMHKDSARRTVSLGNHGNILNVRVICLTLRFFSTQEKGSAAHAAAVASPTQLGKVTWIFPKYFNNSSNLPM